MRQKKLKLTAILLFGLSFIGMQAQTIKDIENNVYKTVKIGKQVWMSENLKTTKFNDGTDIPFVTNDISLSSDIITPSYCWYDNDTLTNKNTYGALYNWYTVSTEKLCPIGWHIPSESDWDELRDFLGGSNLAGGLLMEKGTTHWPSPNYFGTNESGFTALPGGSCNGGGCFGIGDMGQWWSSMGLDESEAWHMELSVYNGSAAYGKYILKSNFFSVRCIKN